MTKIVRPTVELLNEIIFICDDCGIEVEVDKNGVAQVYKCMMCEGHSCVECVETDWYNVVGDHPNRYCKVCWLSGELYRENIKKARESFEQYETKQLKMWVIKAGLKRKDKEDFDKRWEKLILD